MTYPTSTKQDIYENLPALKEYALLLLMQEYSEDDNWETLEVGDKMFDFNIFDWEDDNREPIVCVTVYPVVIDGHQFAKTDMSNFVPLYQKSQSGEITPRRDLTKVAQ
jgi:hypothetical protein